MPAEEVTDETSWLPPQVTEQPLPQPGASPLIMKAMQADSVAITTENLMEYNLGDYSEYLDEKTLDLALRYVTGEELGAEIQAKLDGMPDSAEIMQILDQTKNQINELKEIFSFVFLLISLAWVSETPDPFKEDINCKKSKASKKTSMNICEYDHQERKKL